MGNCGSARSDTSVTSTGDVDDTQGDSDESLEFEIYDTPELVTDTASNRTRHSDADHCSACEVPTREVSPPLPSLNTRNNRKITGFGGFCVELAELLTIAQIINLAMVFEYPSGIIDDLKRSATPGGRFVQLMEERRQISPNDISKLVGAIENVGLLGLAKNVKEKFQKCQHYGYVTMDSTSDENILPYLSLEELREVTKFVSELKRKYENMYNAVQPIPYIRDKLLSVARVFVESGIELFVGKETLVGHGQWSKLSSYMDMFRDNTNSSSRSILEADPGYGKSTITLQIAYDWCNRRPNSLLSRFEIFILLQLKQLGGVKSIYRAIKTFLLPKESTFTEEDIKNILLSVPYVLIVFDGFDEYPDRDSEELSDIMNIIKRDMFQNFKVITTTRTACLPQDIAPQTQRIRLTGFDEKSRDNYIRKAVVSDEEGVTKIKDVFRKNPILADLCEVPLFFAMFAHVTHEAKEMETFNTVTIFFRHMIFCFHQHMKNKQKGQNIEKYNVFSKNHEVLNKLAFEGLNRKDQQIVWEREDMSATLGKEFYEYYVRVGILVEEEVLNIGENDVFEIDVDRIRYVTQVHFFHKVFCEWYAAHFLSECASNARIGLSDDNATDFETSVEDLALDVIDIKYLDPSDVQYVYRFACGINTQAAPEIIKYLKRKHGSMFEILCILEQGKGKLTNVLDDVNRLCERDVQIRDTDSMLKQRTTVQLLTIASSNKIAIKEVWMYYTFHSVDLLLFALKLKSQLALQSLETLRKLVIVEDGKEIISEDICNIFRYTLKCGSLRKLRFVWCLLPKTIPTGILRQLHERGVKVEWSPCSLLRHYRLNLKTGVWKDKDEDTEITEAEYEKLVMYFNERQGRNEKHQDQ